MLSAKIQLIGTGITCTDREKGTWRLDLMPAALRDWIAQMTGTDADLSAMKKYLGKTFDARLSIGAEDDVAGVDQVKAELEVARERIRVLEEIAKMRAGELAAAQATPHVLDVNHPVVKAARGALTVIHEKTQIYSTSTKGSADQARYMELLREARDGLAKIAELVPVPKKNGGAHPEQPAPPAS
jgi:hypothetical protein